MAESSVKLEISSCIFHKSVLYYQRTDAGVMEW